MCLMALWSAKVREIIQGRKATLSRLEAIPRSERRVWFHVASLGEFEQARPLIEAYRQRHPETQLILSFFSSSGYRVRRDYDQVDAVVYFPADSLREVRNYLNVLRPSLAIFVKYDFWPTMLSELHRRGVRTYLVAAMFREEQMFFRPWGGWYRGVLKVFDRIYVQDVTSAALLKRIGLERVTVAGDTRFDRVRQIAALPREVAVARWLKNKYASLLVAGSTWAEDDRLLAEAWRSLGGYGLILVPHELDDRYIDRLIETSPRRLFRLSTLSLETERELDTRGVEGIVVDSIGLLSSLYKYATVAYIGGGFGKGIHNTLEAAVYGVPVLFGPNMSKFREAKGLVACGGAFVVRSSRDILDRLFFFERTPEEREFAGRQCLSYIEGELGATEIILSDIED